MPSTKPEDPVHQYHHSSHLSRQMSLDVHGHAGQPAIVFPCLAGRFSDYADFGMVEALSPWLAAGQLRLFCVDSIDAESWTATHEHPGHRAWLQESYHRYIAEEVVGLVREQTGWAEPLIATGNSMGGMHAAISFFRRPDLFNTFIAFSGIYDAGYFFGDAQDPFVADNSPLRLLADLPDDHPWLDRYRHSHIHTAIGQGAWEDALLPSNHALASLLAGRGVPAQVEFWGEDVSHDWPWWHKMATHAFGTLKPL